MFGKTFLFTILIYSDQSIFFKDPICSSYYFKGGWCQARNWGRRGEVSPALSVKSAPIFVKNALIVSVFELAPAGCFQLRGIPST